MKVLSRPLFTLLFVVSGIVLTFAQNPVVESFSIRKNGFDYVTDFNATTTTARNVPLNGFQIVIAFDANVKPALGSIFDSRSDGGKMFDLRLGAPGSTTGSDLFTGGGIPTTLDIADADVIEIVTGTAPGDKSTITINVRFFNDLIPGQQYTLAIVPSEVRRQSGSDLANPFTVDINTTAEIPAVTIGHGMAEMCNGGVTTLDPITILEQSRHTFTRNANSLATADKTINLVLSDPTNFEFVTGADQTVAAASLGGGSTSFLVGTATTTHVPIVCNIADDDNVFNALYITGLKVRFIGTGDATTYVYAEDNANRYIINGLYSRDKTGTNNPVILGQAIGRASISDPSLNISGAISGADVHCTTGPNHNYLVSPVAGATSYEWTIPTSFTPQAPATETFAGSGIWTTTNNFITVKPGATTAGGLTISARAINNCRRGDPVNKNGITITDVAVSDSKLDALPVTGASTHCEGDPASRYIIPPVSGATHYLWTVPTNFTPQAPAVEIAPPGSGVWSTTNNFIDLIPTTGGSSLSLSVAPTNLCLKGADGTISGININTPTAAGSITFSTPTTSTFSGSGASKSIANNAGPQPITVTSPAGGSVTFSGPGISGNQFFPNIVTLGTTHTISYTFTNANGCTTNGSFDFNVFDAAATISGLINYCNNVTVNQEFRVKTTASGNPINTGNVVLQRVSPLNTNLVLATIGQSPSPGYATGFGFDRNAGTDNIFVLKPSILGTGIYKVTANTTPSAPVPFTRVFRINSAPTPTITGTGVVCAAASSRYSVTSIRGRTYAWSVSGGGTIAGGSDGSSVTINWSPSITTTNHTVTLVETNTFTGCSETTNRTVTVNAQPNPAITGPATSCANANQDYMIGGGVTFGHHYVWEVTGGTVVFQAIDKSRITVKWGTGTGGTVKLTEVNTNTCQASTTTSVTINGLPIPSYSAGANSACVLANNEVYTLNAVSTGHTVTWEVTGGTIQGTGGNTTTSGVELNTITIDWGNAVAGVIRVTERNTDGCDGVLVRNVTLNPLPRLDVTGLSALYCEGSSSATLVARANGAIVSNINNGATTDVGTYTIRDAGNTTTLLTLPSSSFNPNDPLLVKDPVTGIGEFNLVFEYTDVNGCVNSTSLMPFRVEPKPSVEIDNSNVTNDALNDALATGEACAQSTQVYRVKSILPGVKYSWTVTGGIITSFVDDPTHGRTEITVNWGSLTSGTSVSITAFTTATACRATRTADINIIPLPVPTFATAATNACVSSTNQVYSINAVNVLHTVKWVVTGGTIRGGTTTAPNTSEITGTPLNSITVDWGNGTQGSITVTETDTKACSGSTTRLITLTPLPGLAFTGLANSYCENDGTVNLAPTVNGGAPVIPANGVFLIRDAANTTVVRNLGAGINRFDPADIVRTSGTGDYALVYQYTDNLNCFAESLPVIFRVNPAPANVAVNVSRSFDSRKVIFSASADNVTPGWKWNWTFTGANGTRQTDTLTLANNKPQSISYSLLITNAENCTFSLSRVFNIDFSFAGQCLGNPTRFTDATNLAPQTIGGWQWDFGDGNTSTLQNPAHTYATAGTYFVKLTITEGIVSYSLRKRIDIFPVETVTPTSPYSQDFSAGAAGWVSHGTIDSTGIIVDRTSWKLQTPAGFGHIPTDKGIGWVTDNQDNLYRTSTTANYNGNEQSYIETPCFNINALNRPMVSFNYWSDLDNGSDGVVLLYTIDDGTTWFRVGQKDQGLDWYDTKPVLGKPGNDYTTDNGDSQGWSGNVQTTTTKTWKTARFGLDEVVIRMNNAGIRNRIVRFRLAFGSNADNAASFKFDGFAVDDFLITNRNRLVLLEYFTNQSATSTDPVAADLLTHNYATTRTEMLNIHYHTGFPGADEIYNLNDKDPSGWAFHYGVRDVPRPVLDGETQDILIANTYTNSWVDSVFTRRTLLASPFIIDVGHPTATGGVLSVSATVNAIQALNKRVVMQVVVIDSTVQLGGATYHNAVRKMLPDASGTFREQFWVAGESQTLNYTWDYGRVGLDPAKFKVVVFVLDYETKEIYQAGASKVTVNRSNVGGDVNDQNQVTGLAEDLQKGNVEVFPNPASSRLQIALKGNKGLSADARWEVVSMTGQVVKRGLWNRGYSKLSLSIGDLAEGMYIIKVYNEQTTFQHRFEKN